jgi:serine/threonine protein phosphatase PrpC
MAGYWRDRVRGGSAIRKKPIPGRPNEDTILCRISDGLIGVFDGIGAYSEASSASKIARQLCAPVLSKIDRAKYGTLDETLKAIGQAIMVAQEGIVALQEEHPEAGDGGTTATIVKLWQPPSNATVSAIFANIGDSRIYHWKSSTRTLCQLTIDDNMLRQWEEIGWIDEEEATLYTNLIDSYIGTEPLPPGVQEAWEKRNTICAWLGMPDITFTVGAVELSSGDRLVATSDGIHDNLTKEEIADILGRNMTPREVALQLVDYADAIASEDVSPRAKPDDMAAVVLFFDH